MTNSNFQEPPAFYIDAIPGAREAHDEWKSAERDLVPLSAASHKAIQAGLGKGRWHGTPENRRLAPAPGVSTEELEASVRATSDAAAALAAGHRKVHAAYDRFEKVVRKDDLNRGDLRKIAAEIALAKHAEAVDAWAVVQAALEGRDEAYGFAGAPGESWELRGFRATMLARDVVRTAIANLDLRLSGFPVTAVSNAAKAV